MIKYKVFYVEDGKLYSCLLNIRKSPLGQLYRKGWNRAKIGGFLVFNSLENAKKFANIPSDEIWECEVRNPQRIEVNVTILPECFQLFEIVADHYRKTKKWVFVPFAPPTGTEAYKSLKPLRRVHVIS